MRIVTRILTIINNFDSDITMKGFSLVSPDFQKNHLDLVWRKKQSSTPRKSHFRRVVKAGWIFCMERFLPQDQIQVIFLKVRAYQTRSFHGNIAVRILVTIFILVKTLYQNQYRMTFIDEVMQCESNVIFNSSTKWTNIIQSALKTSALDLGALK